MKYSLAAGGASSLTLFACPKAFAGHDGIIQTNALDNWRSLGVTIIILGDDLGVAEAAQEYGCLHISRLHRTKHGTPLLSDIFAKAQEAAETEFVCYVNSDILFPPALPAVAEKVAARFRKNFLMLGRRWDVDIVESLSFEGNWKDRFEALRKSGTPHAPWGMDYFLFRRNSIVMPPFAIGRPQWDNWMIGNAKLAGFSVVDASDALGIIHQNHEYAHVPGRVVHNWQGSPEAEYNRTLLQSLHPRAQWGYLSALDADWRFTGDGRITLNVANRLSWWIRCFSMRTLAGLHGLWAKKAVLKRVIGESAYHGLKALWKSLRNR